MSSWEGTLYEADHEGPADLYPLKTKNFRAV